MALNNNMFLPVDQDTCQMREKNSLSAAHVRIVIGRIVCDIL